MRKYTLSAVLVFCVTVLLLPMPQPVAQDRKLLLGAGGAAVTFDPISLGSIAYGFEADSGAYNDAGVTLATNGQSVTQWNDRSVNARNLSQVGAARPGYSSSGGPNNKPYLSFSSASSQEISRNSAGLGNAPHTVFAVIWPLTVGAGDTTFLFDNQIKWARSTTSLKLTMLGVADYTSTSGQLSAATWAIVAFKFDTSYDVSFYKNGSFINTVTGTSETAGNASLRIGGRGTEYWNGRIVAVYAFSADLSSDDMTRMWTYLNTKYAVY